MGQIHRLVRGGVHLNDCDLHGFASVSVLTRFDRPGIGVRFSVLSIAHFRRGRKDRGICLTKKDRGTILNISIELRGKTP